MSKPDKPFIAYRSGRWNLKIVPCNGAGWRALMLWMAMLALPTALLSWFTSTVPQTEPLIVAHVAYVLAVAGWAVAMIRWMLARSEIVELDELLALKRERDKTKRRR